MTLYIHNISSNYLYYSTRIKVIITSAIDVTLSHYCKFFEISKFYHSSNGKFDQNKNKIRRFIMFWKEKINLIIIELEAD